MKTLCSDTRDAVRRLMAFNNPQAAKVLKIISENRVIQIADLTRKTQFLTASERSELLQRMFEKGALIQCFKQTKGRTATGVALSESDADSYGWTVSEPDQSDKPIAIPKTDAERIAGLESRVAYLERILFVEIEELKRNGNQLVSPWA